MMNKIKNKKLFMHISLILLCIFLLSNKVYAFNGPISGGGENAGDCPSCTWVYGDNGKGLKVSLYQYNGTTLRHHKSIDFLNNPSVWTIDMYYGDKPARYEYNGVAASFNSKRNRSTFKKFSDFGMTNINSSSGWAAKKEEELSEYFGETADENISAVKAMFGNSIPITKTNLSEFYIVLEPSIVFVDQTYWNYYYATGYEAMTIYNNNAGFGNWQWSTVRDYLYNGMYVSKNSEYLFDTDGRYDEHNFVNENSGKGALAIAKSSISSADNIRNNYKDRDFSYGLGVLWVARISIGKGCPAVCSGKTGDALLQCAENFCSKSDDVTDTATKKDCIINQCKYEPSQLTCSGSSTTNGSATVCADQTSAKKSTCEMKTQDGIRYRIKCNVSSKITFPDTLPKTILPGEGFQYQVRLYGDRICYVEFDKAKWKLDYAASYTAAERQNLETAISNYNNKNFNLTFSSKNGTIKINIKEKKTNSATIGSTTKTLVAQEKYSFGNESVDKTSTSSTVKSFYTEGETSKTKTLSVKSFKTESSNEVLYDLPKVCISNEDNISVEEGSTCKNGLGPYTEYFTTIHAEKAKNDTKTEATHSSSGLDVDNTCYYEVTPDELSCHISVNNQCGRYFNAVNNVVFTLSANYNYNRNDKTILYNIGTSKLNTKEASSYNGKKTYTILNTSITKPTEVTIYGTVTDGTNIKHCSQTVTIYPNSNKCEFIKTTNPSNGTVTLSIKDIGVEGAVYQTRKSTNDSDEGWMNLKSRTIKSDEKIILEGRILVNGTVIRDCFYQDDITCPECTSLYKPAEYAKIKEHCASYWQIDRAGYTSYDNCVDHCTTGRDRPRCPETCKDTTGEAKATCARNYCNEFYEEDGYVKIGDCINDCYPDTGLDYYYRTINNDDPFPQRQAHYNWIGYEEYITDDDDDSTPSRGGSHPEYEIKLDKERMAKINQNTYNYNSGSGNTAYSDYIRVNSTDTGKYKSKFIHVDDPNEGGFKTYFTYIEGSKVGG